MADWGQGSSNPEDKSIGCGTFYPAITRKEFFDAYRIPLELPLSTVDTHLRQGIINVRRALKEWKAEQEIAGCATLASVPQEEVDDVGELTVLWNRAVYCEAKAEVLKETESANRREIAENSAKTSEETEEKYREFAQDAIRMIVGEGRVSIDII